uniref:Uncharacterized protein n=1 Tax=Nelumbo nucifera TaxID=4432 RepID=A0A822ZR09_NELNU|nr:TPA_asm: hypothetical protein HUJ06_003606 [Nelumbo nucifera]
MAMFFGCFFFCVLLVLSVASVLPSSDALDADNCRKVVFTPGICNLPLCKSWCSRNFGGQATCFNNDESSTSACVCVYC